MATKKSSPAFSDRFFGEGLTFDDVLLMPGYSEVLPREVDIRSQLTRSITLHVPLLSAAMDTVTEASLAIALAREGGLGILHKNMSIERQAEQVRKVKRSESGMIIDPLTLRADATIGQALRMMQENKIGGIPIVDQAGKLVGILTNRDLRFEIDLKRKVSEVMTSKDLYTAPAGTDLKKAEQLFKKTKVEKLPIIDKQGKLVGLFTYSDILKLKSNPNAVKDGFGRLLVGAGVGITKDFMDRVAALYQVGVDVIAMDSAHGHSKGVIDALKKVKKEYKGLQVIAGNVGTAAGAKALADAGADAVKVGIGPGSICTTRIVAGTGVPQLTAIMEAAHALKQKNVPVIADGGIRYTGDMVKALAAGANCVMMGSVFAGTEESPGETIIYEGRKFKTYRGMGSLGAMATGSSDRYFQDAEQDVKKFVPEGIEGRVAYKGYLKEVVYQYTGGLRAGMGYCGAKNIAALQKATFIKITNAGMHESHAHDIDITKEAPNYSRK
ncbi:MAG: IMP dehydrogenase [Bacteroidetes bacterium]|jgi:IMP dehydrogenase|nr:IMP dehydrogenase [Bacteroidota bacterium]